MTAKQTPQILAPARLREIVNEAGVTWFDMLPADDRYVASARSWVLNKLMPAWQFVLVSLDLSYEEDAFDCDDYARMLAGYGGILQRKTKSHPPSTALALGELWYYQDSGGEHAVNIAVVRLDPGQELGVIFIEPQTAQIIQLTEDERSSAYYVRF